MKSKSDFTSEVEFDSTEDIFNLFAKATITGRLLPVARLINKSFGRGSFSEIGEMSADHPDFEPN